MASRAPIIAGKTVILLQVQDTVDSALDSVRKKLSKFSSSIGAIGADLFRGGIVGTLGIGAALRQFQNFEDAILFLRTKLEGTEDQLASVEKKIRDLGKTTSFTARQVAEGATILAQAGLNAQEVSNTLQPTLDLARGAQIELGAAGEILVNTMRSFGIETSRASDVASQFNVAARLGTLDVLDLKESLKEVLGTLRALNVDLPTALAFITQLAERSLRGTKAGTSLNTALLQLASKKDVIRNALNIDLPDNISGDTFITFLEQLYDRLNKLGNLQRVAILQSIFNIRGGRAITALDDIKKILDLQKRIKNAGDEARRAAIIMDSGFGGAIRRAVGAVGDLGITLGKIQSGPLISLLTIIPPLTDAIGRFAIENQLFVLALSAIPPGALLAGVGLLSLSFVLKKISGVIGLTAVGFRSLGGAIVNGLNAQLTSAIRLLNTFGRAAKGIDAKLAQNLLGVADPQKVAAAQRRVGNARTKVRRAELTGDLARIAKARRSLLFAQRSLASASKSSFFGRIGKTQIPGSISTIGVALKQIIAGIGPALNRIFSGLGRISFSGIVKGLFSGIKAGLTLLTKIDPVTILYKIFIGFGRVTKGVFIALNAVRRFVFSFSGIFTILELLLLFGDRIEIVRKAMERISIGFGNAFAAIGRTFTDIIPAVDLFKESIRSIAGGKADDGFKGIIQSLGIIWKILTSNIKTALFEIKLAFQPLLDFFDKLFKIVGALAELVGTFAGGLFGTLGSGLGKVFGSGDKTLGENLKAAFESLDIKEIFLGIGALFTGVAQVLVDVFKGIYSLIANAVLGFQQVIAEVTKTLGVAITKLPDRIFGDAGDAGLSLINASNDFSLAALKLNRTINETQADFDRLPNKFQTALEVFAAAMERIFPKIIAQGFTNAIVPGQPPAPGFIAETRRLAALNAAGNVNAPIEGQVPAPNITIAERRKQLNQQRAAERKRRAAFDIDIKARQDFADKIAVLALGESEEQKKINKEIDAEKKRRADKAAEFNKVQNTLDALEDPRKAEKQKIDAAKKAILEAKKDLGQTRKLETERRRQADLQIGLQEVAITNMKAIGRDPEQIAEAQKVLNETRKAELDKRSKFEKSFEAQQEALNGGPSTRKQILEARRAAFQQMKADLKNGVRGRFAPVAGDIRGLVDAVSGDIRSTRFNRVRIATGNIQQQQLNVLEQVSEKLGPGDAGSSYLKKLEEKAGPLVFQ